MADSDFVRDPKSQALINANELAYKSYKASRDAQNLLLMRLNRLEAFMTKYEPILEKLLKDTDV